MTTENSPAVQNVNGKTFDLTTDKGLSGYIEIAHSTVNHGVDMFNTASIYAVKMAINPDHFNLNPLNELRNSTVTAKGNMSAMTKKLTAYVKKVCTGITVEDNKKSRDGKRFCFANNDLDKRAIRKGQRNTGFIAWKQPGSTPSDREKVVFSENQAEKLELKVTEQLELNAKNGREAENAAIKKALLASIVGIFGSVELAVLALNESDKSAEDVTAQEQATVESLIQPESAETPQELTPAQKAAITRAENKAKKEAIAA